MSATILMPPAAFVPDAIAQPFVELALAAEALPLDIDGVARIGCEFGSGTLPAQIDPLLSLDGSPRPENMYGIRYLESFHDILDTRSRDVVGDVHLDDFASDEIALSSVHIMQGHKTIRSILAEYRGDPELLAVSAGYRGVAKRMEGEGVKGIRLASIHLVAAAMAAASPMMDELGVSSFKRAIEMFGDLSPKERCDEDPLGYSARALLYENLAWAVGRHGFGNFRADDTSPRLRASDMWRGWVAMLNFGGPADIEDETSTVLYNRILNGAQLGPERHLDKVFSSYFIGRSPDEAVKNHIRAAWSQLIDVLSPRFGDEDNRDLTSDAWDAVSGHMLEVGDILKGDVSSDVKTEFEGDKGEDMMDLANGLAFKAVMMAEGKRRQESTAY